MYPPGVSWRKSTFSGSQSDCVEVARTATMSAVRDSKNPTGPILRADLSALLGAVKAGTIR